MDYSLANVSTGKIIHILTDKMYTERYKMHQGKHPKFNEHYMKKVI